MFVLKRDPIQWSRNYFYSELNANTKNSGENNDSEQEIPINPLQFLLSLTDINYIFTKLASLLSLAWETIAFAWVENLIQTPDQYQQYKYKYNQRCQRQRQDHSHQNQQYSEKCDEHHCIKYEYECDFQPMPNVFDSWSRSNISNSSHSDCSASSSNSSSSNERSKTNRQQLKKKCTATPSDSWGQFVDVDISNHLPRKECFIR